MTERDEKYRQKYQASLAPKVEGEIRAIGIFSRAGSMGAMFASQVSPLAGGLMLGRGKKKAKGMPMNVILAATDDQVWAFEFKPKGFGIKVKDPVAVWDRSAVQVGAQSDGTIAKRIEIHVGEETLELDENKMPGLKSEFNEPFLTLLST